jgi:hypothetical protein
MALAAKANQTPLPAGINANSLYQETSDGDFCPYPLNEIIC